MSRIKYELPTLYSARNCPFCIRARMAIASSAIIYEHREVDLKDMTIAVRHASPKGTVPVLVMPDGQVIEESLDIMHWALRQNDCLKWLDVTIPDDEAEKLIAKNDSVFASSAWNASKAGTDIDEAGMAFLKEIESILQSRKYLGGEHMTLVDIAILPFMQQYAERFPKRREEIGFTKWAAWVEEFENLPLYTQVMAEAAIWTPESMPLIIHA